MNEDLPLLPEREFTVSCINLFRKSNLLFALGTYRPSIKVFNLSLQAILLDRNISEYPINVISLDNLNKYYMLTNTGLEIHGIHGKVKNIKLSFIPRGMILFEKVTLIIGNKPIIKIIDKSNKLKDDLNIPIEPLYITSYNDVFGIANTDEVCLYKEYKLIHKCKVNELNSFTFDNQFIYIGNSFGLFYKINLLTNESFDLYQHNESINQIIRNEDSFILSSNTNIIIIKNDTNKIIELGCKINSIEIDKSILFVGCDDGKIRIYNVGETKDLPEWCINLIK